MLSHFYSVYFLQNQFFMRYFLFLSLLVFSFSSCVTKKKYLQSLSDKTQVEAHYLDSIAGLQDDLTVRGDTISALRLNLAERIGENNILEKLRHELQGQIDELELDIELRSNRSASSSQSTKKKLAEKDNKIKNLKAQLVSVETAIKKYQNRVLAFIGDVNMDFQGYDDKLLSVNTKGNTGVLKISANSLLFKRVASTSLNDRGKSVIQKISNIIKKYPDLEVYVVGHTDTKPPAKTYKDNWYFSTLRAVTVVREMTQNNGVNNNQVFPVGKAEFSPIASNETAEGRAENQRIEIIVKPLNKNMVKEVLKIVSGVR